MSVNPAVPTGTFLAGHSAKVHVVRLGVVIVSVVRFMCGSSYVSAKIVAADKVKGSLATTFF